jgi:peptidyl-prolyl cis-trans isomerase C
MRRNSWPGWALLGLAVTLTASQEAANAPSVASESDVDPNLVATVNGDPVYLEDLERKLNAAHTGQTEGRRGAFDTERLVDRVIDDALVAQEGRAMEMQLEPPIPQRLEAMRRRLALERLEQEEIHDKVHVDDEDLRRTFEQDYETVTLRIITVHEREEADRLWDQLKEGGDFEAMAAEHSVDQYATRGGLMEDLARKDLPAEIVASAWRLEPGQRTGPVRTSLGWSLLQVEGFVEPSPERFDGLKEWLREEVRIREAATLRSLLAKRLRKSLGAKIDRDVLDAITVERLDDGRLSARIEDPAAPVARIGERTISAGELGPALNKRWKRVRNEEAALAAKSLVLQRLLRDELLQIEALRRGYGETPRVQRALRAYETELVARKYVNEIVAPRIEVSPEELRAYYDEHLEEFRKPPRVHLGQITVKEEDEAERLAELLRQGTDLAWLARQHSVDRFKEVGGDRGWMMPGIRRPSDAGLRRRPGRRDRTVRRSGQLRRRAGRRP